MASQNYNGQFPLAQVDPFPQIQSDDSQPEIYTEEHSRKSPKAKFSARRSSSLPNILKKMDIVSNPGINNVSAESDSVSIPRYQDDSDSINSSASSFIEEVDKVLRQIDQKVAYLEMSEQQKQEEIKVNNIQLEIDNSEINLNESVIKEQKQTTNFLLKSKNEIKNIFEQERNQIELTKKLLSQEQQQQIENKQLMLVRKWVDGLTIFFSIGLAITLRRDEDRINFISSSINWILTIMMVVLSIYSRIKNLKAIYIAIVLGQFRMINALFQLENILQSENPEGICVFTTIMFMGSIMNQAFISHLFISYKNIMNASTVALLSIAMLQRFYGYEKLSSNIGQIIIPTLEIILCSTLWIFVNQSLQNLNLDICIEANKSQMEMKVMRSLQEEFQQIFESLQEGIVVISNGVITFKNSIFTQLFVEEEIEAELPFLMDLKIFKLFRKAEEEDQFNNKSQKSSRKSESRQNMMRSQQSGSKKSVLDFGNVFSLKQLIKLDQQHLEDKIFELLSLQPRGIPGAEGGAAGEVKSSYKYVHLKINKIRQDNKSQAQKLLIQIIDMSDKMLYNEIKAEKSFLTLINAAISHELRNPLNSLIGQMNSMQSFFDSFSKILYHLKKSKDDQIISKDIVDQLDKIYNGMYSCGSKIFSATKFIDYFVHDILDYTILNKQQKNFTKNSVIIDIRDAIQEIMDIQHDKIAMKTIQISSHFKNFKLNNKENFIIKTDIKRLQQVFLNLMSNAIKFTDRNGKITIIVEKYQHDFVRLSVIDNGIGIKNKDQDKLFKLFGSIKDEKKQLNTNGIGLGLVISKLIVNKFNGYIDFLSKYKKGSTFFYTFQIEQHDQEFLNPRLQPHKNMTMDLSKLQILEDGMDFQILKKNVDPTICFARVSLSQAMDIFNSFNKHKDNRILVIDDEEFCLSSMRAVLFSLGVDVDYQVEFCITGKEAYEQIKRTYEWGMKYALIFTDFNMPVMNGINATVKIRKYLENDLNINREDQPKIIGVTGHVMDSFKQEGRKAGMDEILGKPLYADALKEIFNKYYSK